jgi:hypothetical protein
MSTSDDALEQSKRLLDKRESDQVEFETSIQDSKRALARSQTNLDQLKKTIAEAIAARKVS